MATKLYCSSTAMFAHVNYVAVTSPNRSEMTPEVRQRRAVFIDLQITGGGFATMSADHGVLQL